MLLPGPGMPSIQVKWTHRREVTPADYGKPFEGPNQFPDEVRCISLQSMFRSQHATPHAWLHQSADEPGFKLQAERPTLHPHQGMCTTSYGHPGAPAQSPAVQDLLPGYRDTMLEYHAACTQCMRRIARCMAVALDLPEDYFAPHLTNPIASLRHMRYLPTVSDPAKVCH